MENLEQIQEKIQTLCGEINKLREKEQNLLVGKFKDKLNKYFKNDEDYIKITNIWASSKSIYIEGIYFSGQFIEDYSDCHWFDYSAFHQYEFRTTDINSWEDFGFEEISKEDFYYAFNDMLDSTLKSLNKFIIDA